MFRVVGQKVAMGQKNAPGSMVPNLMRNITGLNSYRNYCARSRYSNYHQTNIIELNSIAKLSALIPREFYVGNTIAAIDIDDTIYEPKEDANGERLGSDAWFEDKLIKEMHQLKQSPEFRFATESALCAAAVNNIVPVYNKLQASMQVQLVEGDDTAAMFNSLQQRIPSFLVTARHHELIVPTQRHIEQVAFKLHPKYQKLTAQLQVENKLIKVDNGTIYCGGMDKGKVFIKVMPLLECIPQNILVIDDKRKNIESIVKEFGRLVNVFGVHYTHVKHRELLKNKVVMEKYKLR